MDLFDEYFNVISGIFGRIPNLKALELDIYRTTMLPVFIEAMKLVPSLESLTVRCLSETDMMRFLATTQRFKSLTLNELQLNHNSTVLREFLETHQSTLEVLSLRVMGNRDVSPVPLPHLPELKTLRIDTYFSSDVIPFEKIYTGAHLPALQKLVISQELIETFFDPAFTSGTVQDLTIYMTDLQTNLASSWNAIQDDNLDPGLGIQVSNIAIINSSLERTIGMALVRYMTHLTVLFSFLIFTAFYFAICEVYVVIYVRKRLRSEIPKRLNETCDQFHLVSCVYRTIATYNK
jgi:hypothetical protein